MRVDVHIFSRSYPFAKQPHLTRSRRRARPGHLSLQNPCVARLKFAIVILDRVLHTSYQSTNQLLDGHGSPNGGLRTTYGNFESIPLPERPRVSVRDLDVQIQALDDGLDGVRLSLGFILDLLRVAIHGCAFGISIGWCCTHGSRRGNVRRLGRGDEVGDELCGQALAAIRAARWNVISVSAERRLKGIKKGSEAHDRTPSVMMYSLHGSGAEAAPFALTLVAEPVEEDVPADGTSADGKPEGGEIEADIVTGTGADKG